MLSAKQGPAFLPKYEAFLRLTGIGHGGGGGAASLGKDTTKPEFWADALRSLEEPLAQYKELIAQVLPATVAGGARSGRPVPANLAAISASCDTTFLVTAAVKQNTM